MKRSTLLAVCLGGICILAIAGLFKVISTVIDAFSFTMPPNNNLPVASIPAPSKTTFATKSYSPIEAADPYFLKIVTPTGSMPILTAENPSGVIDRDGAILAWNDERHLVIGWPTAEQKVEGPRQVGNIQVNYILYEPDLDQEHPQLSHRKTLHNASYSFEETPWESRGERKYDLKKCIIHMSANDGKFYDRITIDYVGTGTGIPSEPYHGAGGIGIKLGLSRLQNGQSPPLTLTQAKFDTVYPTIETTALRKSSPRQGDLSLLYNNKYSQDEAIKIVSLMRQGKLDIKIGLGFGQRHIVYTGMGKIDQNIIDQFNTCSSKTNIYGNGFALPK